MDAHLHQHTPRAHARAVQHVEISGGWRRRRGVAAVLDERVVGRQSDHVGMTIDRPSRKRRTGTAHAARDPAPGSAGQGYRSDTDQASISSTLPRVSGRSNAASSSSPYAITREDGDGLRERHSRRQESDEGRKRARQGRVRKLYAKPLGRTPRQAASGRALSETPPCRRNSRTRRTQAGTRGAT